MYTLELHDDDTNNITQGTLAGSTRGTIDFAYQIEMHLQDVIDGPWRRAYLKVGNDVKVIWARDDVTGELRYLAKTPDYNGEWVLPFVETPDARIAIGIWGTNASTDTQALEWATTHLSNAVTAILMDRGKIRAAWELFDEKPVLIARGPNTLG